LETSKRVNLLVCNNLGDFRALIEPWGALELNRKNMEQLISNIASKIGIGEDLSKKAVSMVLSLVREQGDDSLVGQLFDKMPGATDLADEGTSTLESGKGSGGGLMGMVGGMLGGGAGQVMSAVSQLQAEGLDTDQIKKVGREVLNHAKEQGGDDLVGKITSSIPGLENLR
jgi:hypothetical protein